MANVTSPASSPSSENVPLASVLTVCPPPVTSAPGTAAPVPMSVTMPNTVPGSAETTNGGWELLPLPPLPPPLLELLVPLLPLLAALVLLPSSPQAVRLQHQRMTATERLSLVLM